MSMANFKCINTHTHTLKSIHFNRRACVYLCVLIYVYEQLLILVVSHAHTLLIWNF